MHIKFNHFTLDIVPLIKKRHINPDFFRLSAQKNQVQISSGPQSAPPTVYFLYFVVQLNKRAPQLCRMVIGQSTITTRGHNRPKEMLQISHSSQRLKKQPQFHQPHIIKTKQQIHHVRHYGNEYKQKKQKSTNC